jgi:two-component system, NtrC family, response regulator AtoC
MPRALLVDDDKKSLSALAEWVTGEGFEVKTAATLAEAREALADGPFNVMLIDLQLPDGSGIDLICELEQPLQMEILMITGYGTVDTAVQALKGGAVDYLTKPVDLKRLRKSLAHVRDAAELRDQVTELRGELRRLGRFGCLLGASPPMQQIYDLIARVAPTDASVFVTGETGVGKELVARMVHTLSRRSKKPFLPINCAAVPPNLMESELFGHEKGSFTGADRQRKGIFERADGGTLFLDEVSEMPVELQAKLLRVLETGMVTRVGGEQPEKTDVRIVAATNRDPEQAVGAGQMRQDLLYRLNLFPIKVPPLRERGSDVKLLAEYFLGELNQADAQVPNKALSTEAVDALIAYPWPGNVRELKNVIERAFILGPERIGAEDIPLSGRLRPERPGSGLEFNVGMSIAEMERRMIMATLEKLQGNKREAARVLGIGLKTLYTRLSEYGK